MVPFTGRPVDTIPNAAYLLGRYLSEGNSVSVLNTMKEAYDSRTPFFPKDPTDENVRWAFQKIGDTMIILLAGANNRAQAAVVIDDWKSLNVRRDGPGEVIHTAARQAMEIFDYLIPRGLRDCMKIHIFGYSLGGCIGEALILYMHRRGINALKQICTFGSPKCLRQPAREQLNNVVSTNYRIMLSNDPIPKMPIPMSEDRTLIPIIGAINAHTWASWGHALQGVEIRLDDKAYTAYTPSEVTMPTPIGLAAWYAGLNNTISSTHAMARYLSKCNHEPNPFAPADVIRRVEPPVPPIVPPAVIARQAAQVDREILARARLIAQQGVIIPTSRRATVKKSGRLYNVMLDGEVMGTYARRKNARRHARNLNRFLASTLEAAAVGIDANIIALNQWFIDAMDATLGFGPPLQQRLL